MSGLILFIDLKVEYIKWHLQSFNMAAYANMKNIRRRWIGCIAAIKRRDPSFENLLQEYPDNKVLKETLEDARFKAGFDSRQRIRPRRWIFRSSRRIGRAIILVGILLLLWQGYLILQKQNRTDPGTASGSPPDCQPPRKGTGNPGTAPMG